MADNTYANISPTDYSERVQALHREEREIYEMLKAHKAKLLAAVREETPPEFVGLGREIKNTTYTRWGQWQLVIGDKAVVKSGNGSRPTLADFLAQQQASGRAF